MAWSIFFYNFWIVPKTAALYVNSISFFLWPKTIFQFCAEIIYITLYTWVHKRFYSDLWIILTCLVMLLVYSKKNHIPFCTHLFHWTCINIGLSLHRFLHLINYLSCMFMSEPSFYFDSCVPSLLCSNMCLPKFITY